MDSRANVTRRSNPTREPSVLASFCRLTVPKKNCEIKVIFQCHGTNTLPVAQNARCHEQEEIRGRQAEEEEGSLRYIPDAFAVPCEREKESLVIRQGPAEPPCRNARMEEDGREFSLSTMIGRK